MGLWSRLAGILIFLSAAFSQEAVVNTTISPRTLHQGPLETGWSFSSLPGEKTQKASPPMGDAMLTGLGGVTSFTFEGIQIFVFGQILGTMKTVFQVDGNPATASILNAAPTAGLLGATVLLYTSPALPNSSHILSVICSPDTIIFAQTTLTNFTITSIPSPAGGTSDTQPQSAAPTPVPNGKPSVSPGMPSTSSPSISSSLEFDSSALSSSTPSSAGESASGSSTPSSIGESLTPSSSTSSSSTQHAPAPSEAIRIKKSGIAKGLIGGLTASLLGVAALVFGLLLWIRRRRRIWRMVMPHNVIEIANVIPTVPRKATATASGGWSNDSESLLSGQEPRVQIRSSGAMPSSPDQSRHAEDGGVRLAGGPLTRGPSVTPAFDQSEIPPAYAVYHH